MEGFRLIRALHTPHCMRLACDGLGCEDLKVSTAISKQSADNPAIYF